MALIRWEPFGRGMAPWRGFDSLRRRMDSLFDDFQRGESPDLFQSNWMPSVDISENADSLTIHAEVPGMSKKDVKISIQDNILTISGQKKLEREKKEQNYHLVERTQGEFTRSFTLPSRVDSNNVKAEIKDGVLEIELPKTPEAKAREIEIQVK